MTTIQSFINRLKRIDIEVELVGNYPWIYLDKVNGKKVTDTFQANHGFTVFFLGSPDKITDISTIFKQIRKML